MKGKFDAYVLWPLAKMFQNWIVDRSTARDFTVFDDQFSWDSQKGRDRKTSILVLAFETLNLKSSNNNETLGHTPLWS